MALEAIKRLEKLVDRLLSDRADLQERNLEVTAERDRLLQDRSRVTDELDKLLDKLERLEGKNK
ncbi:cell division protein ZapB [Deltaproteobacteria bacterium IMCC39524]|nr:cell division protein ZapB [Deltaproteobacteria bacterium IMCC39524]